MPIFIYMLYYCYIYVYLSGYKFVSSAIFYLQELGAKQKFMIASLFTAIRFSLNSTKTKDLTKNYPILFKAFSMQYFIKYGMIYLEALLLDRFFIN